MVTLAVDSIGRIPIVLDESLKASKTILELANANTTGKVHRAEPLPPPGSNGPPYALVQFSLSANALAKLPHEGTVNALAFTADAQLLASGGMDKHVRVWDVSSGSQLQALQHEE